MCVSDSPDDIESKLAGDASTDSRICLVNNGQMMKSQNNNIQFSGWLVSTQTQLQHYTHRQGHMAIDNKLKEALSNPGLSFSDCTPKL